jgi:4'-phosphopantetheinyl transferase
MESEVDLGSEWNTPPPAGSLQPLEVHVWIANLNLSPEQMSALPSVLSEEERQRAARFRFEKDRGHYVAGRTFLRQILGSYLQVSPDEIRFGYNDYGKPFLAGLPGNKLKFNVAHSHGLALFGLTPDLEIGVDIEQIRAEFATREIAERFFAGEEIKELGICDPGKQTEAFFDCWTRKEAFVKARGLGLSLPLDQFVVGFGPKTPAALFSAKADPQARTRWSIRALPTPRGYAGAVAVDAPGIDLRLWRFDLHAGA